MDIEGFNVEVDPEHSHWLILFPLYHSLNKFPGKGIGTHILHSYWNIVNPLPSEGIHHTSTLIKCFHKISPLVSKPVSSHFLFNYLAIFSKKIFGNRIISYMLFKFTLFTVISFINLALSL